MAPKLISAGPPALALYHSHQSVGLVKRPEPICFTVDGDRVVEYVLVHIRGLLHLPGNSGTEFLITCEVVDNDNRLISEGLGYYSGRYRKGHLVMPVSAKDERVAGIQARAHRMHLSGTFTSEVARYVRQACRSRSLSKTTPELIMEGLKLPYNPGPA